MKDELRAQIIPHAWGRARLLIILVILLIICAIGGAVAIYGTANGPWGFSDAVAYLSTARSILQGKGVGYYEGDAQFDFSTHLPIFYSLVLSVFALCGSHVVVAARWLNVLSFILSIFVSGWLFWRYSSVKGLGIVSSALLCAFPFMSIMACSAFSESLFVLLLLSSGVSLLAYVQEERLSRLLLAAVVIGLLPLTRYLGLAVPFCGALIILCFSSGVWQRRVKRMLLFALIAYLPILCWFGWAYLSGHQGIGERDFYIIDWGTLAVRFKEFRGLFVDTIRNWTPFRGISPLPYRWRYILLAFGFLIVVISSAISYRRLGETTGRASMSDFVLFAFFGVAAVALLVVLLGSYIWASPTPDVDNRILLPVYVGIVESLLGAWALWQAAWLQNRQRWAQVIPWLIALVCLWWYIPQLHEKIEYYHGGIGWTASHWDSSEIIRYVRTLPPSTPVISNDWPLLMLWADRPVYGFWNTFPVEDETLLPYGLNQADPLQVLFCEQDAVLVIFADFEDQFKTQGGTTPSGQEAYLFDGLMVAGTYSEGTIYRCPFIPHPPR